MKRMILSILCLFGAFKVSTVEAVDMGIMGQIYNGNWKYSESCIDEMKRSSLEKKIDAYLMEVYMAHLSGNGYQMNRAFRCIDTILLSEDMDREE